jgi:hypothetical protein
LTTAKHSKNSVVTPATAALTPSADAACKEGGEVFNMRILALVALAAMALGLGACAKHEAATSTTSTASTGYSK